MAVDSTTLHSFTVFVRRNALTLIFTVIGVFLVGLWYSNIEGRITRVERKQTISREVTRFNCIEHPQGHLCLVGVRRAIARCLEDTRCSALLVSAPVVHQGLREAEAPRHLTGHPAHGPPPESSPAPVVHEGHPGTGNHHAHAPPAHHPPHHGHGHGGGGHHGKPPKPSGPPPVPEPTTPAPAPAPPATPGNAPPGKGGEVCLRNPLLPACLHVGSGSVEAEVGAIGVEIAGAGR